MNLLKSMLSRIRNFKLKKLLCGIGQSQILHDQILITAYPFKPSAAHPNFKINAQSIDAISFDSYPPLIKLDNECIFISRAQADELKAFAIRNQVKIFKASLVWDWILEPFLDTAYTDSMDTKLMKLLAENGISKVEVQSIRKEVETQMMKYNFDTMLWEWVSLGLSDVLAAMRAKYSDRKFNEFYFKAMEIQLRNFKC